jgi:hypothetical protein
MSFENVKRLGQGVSSLDPRRIVHKGPYSFDRETMLHQDHIRNGGTGYGSAMDAASLARIDAALFEEGFGFLRAAAREESEAVEA